MAANIKIIGVVGTGVIGASWTLLFLAHGLQVVVTDPATEAETKLAEYIDHHWPIVAGLGLHSSASKSNYRFVKDITSELPSLDFVQENAPERVGLKRSLIASLDKGLRPEVIIASSSSGLPSSQFIQDCQHPERVLIAHPWNPPHLIPLVELVPHDGTTPELVGLARDFYASLGKAPVVLNRECPGFIGNRLQAVVCYEAFSLISRGLVSAEDLDTVMTSGLGLRWATVGPLTSMSLGGGGGIKGYEHITQHLGPAMDEYMQDIRKNQYDFSDANAGQAIFNSVSTMLEQHDPAAVEAARDQLTIGIIAMKAGK